jgi:hypothetical protein
MILFYSALGARTEGALSVFEPARAFLTFIKLSRDSGQIYLSRIPIPLYGPHCYG